MFFAFVSRVLRRRQQRLSSEAASPLRAHRWWRWCWPGSDSLLEPQRMREAGEAGRRLVIIEHRPRGSRTGLAHKVSLNPFD